MKKKVISILLILVLLLSMFSLTACSPYEAVKKIVDKMVETQKYTMEVSSSGNFVGLTGDLTITQQVDGGKMHSKIVLNASVGGFSSSIDKDFYYYTDTAGKRQEYSKNLLGKWDKAVVSAEENKANDYVQVDFDWDKFTEDYFDVTGAGELTLKKEKVSEFCPAFGSMLEYYKVKATGSSLSIEYSIKVSDNLSNVTKISVSEVGKTTVTLPQ